MVLITWMSVFMIIVISILDVRAHLVKHGISEKDASHHRRDNIGNSYHQRKSFHNTRVKELLGSRGNPFDLYKRGTQQKRPPTKSMLYEEWCPSTYVKGPDGCCIPPWGFCDMYKDCEDGYDERKDVCHGQACEEGHYRCVAGRWSGTCIRTSQLCDGRDDCGGGGKFGDEDTAHCLTVACSKGEVKCGGGKYLGRCIERFNMCDGHSECTRDGTKRGWDEKPSNCEATPCTYEHEFMCPLRSERQGQCISRSQMCNGQDDCGGGADEVLKYCLDTPCPQSQKPCLNGKCFFSYFECDGDDDCGDGSDEDPRKCGKK